MERKTENTEGAMGSKTGGVITQKRLLLKKLGVIANYLLDS